MHDPAADKLAHPAPAEPTTPEGRKLKEQADASIANMNEHFDQPSGLGQVVDDDQGQPSDGSMPGG
jgi:hypothetical protein